MSIESSSPDRLPTAETILRDLGQSGASGVLEINHPAGEMSHVWVRGGRIYAMQVPGYRPALGIRLLSGGLVSPEQLSAAAAEQRDRFPGHLIGQVLVGMGFVDAQVIDAFVRDQVRDQVADLLDLEVISAEFHPGRHVRQDIIEPTDIDQLLAVARENRDRRAEVLRRVGGAHVTPVLGPPGTGPAQTPLGPYDWALLCRVDGRRNLTELARVCGFTVVEAAQVVADLAMTGLLAIPAPAPEDDSTLAPVVTLHPPAEPADPQWRFDGTDAGEPDPVAAAAPDPPPQRSGELLAEFGALLRDEPAPPGEPIPPEDPAPLGDRGAPRGSPGIRGRARAGACSRGCGPTGACPGAGRATGGACPGPGAARACDHAEPRRQLAPAGADGRRSLRYAGAGLPVGHHSIHARAVEPQ